MSTLALLIAATVVGTATFVGADSRAAERSGRDRPVEAAGAAIQEAPEPRPAITPQGPELADRVARAHRTITGVASWYGPGFAGRTTASGATYDPSRMVAAHRTLPFGTRVRVTNRANGRSVVVRIIDRGPYAGGRVLDVSSAAADALAMKGAGTAPVTIEVL